MEDLKDSPENLLGTCQEMCPIAEYRARQKQKRLSIFETSSNDHSTLPVKEYSRPAAGKQICLTELRPAAVLVKTMNYLIDSIIDRKDQPWRSVYFFVFDRVRAIRQDLVIQRIEDESAVEILEKSVRFFILSHYNLQDCSLEYYDAYINDNHLQECLKRLLVLYDNNIPSKDRAEFETLYLLHNVNSNDAILRVLELSAALKSHRYLKIALGMSLSVLLGNFLQFFKLSMKLPFLARCLVQKNAPNIRCNALAALNTAFSNPNCKFPLQLLVDILAFGDTDTAREFVGQFGIKVENDHIQFSKKTFMIPEKLTESALAFINENRPCLDSTILQGISDTEVEHVIDKIPSNKVGLIENEKHVHPRGVKQHINNQVKPLKGGVGGEEEPR